MASFEVGRGGARGQDRPAAIPDGGYAVAGPPNTVDAYIAASPESVQSVPTEIRRTIQRAAPGCEERMSYQIPAFRLSRTRSIYVGAWKRRIGLYPIPRFDGELDEALARYRRTKDTLHFPRSAAVPYSLIERIVTALLAEGRQGKA